MLLRFGVANHRSIREKQVISLVASELDDAAEGLITSPGAPGLSLLPAAVMYGANASGKSNLVSALRWMKSRVLSVGGRSFNGGRPSPFLLDSDSRRKPTECDIDFIIDGMRYHYGFEVTEGLISAEWLFSFPNGQEKLLFERTFQKFEFSPEFKGPNKTIEKDTRAENLFLSMSGKYEHPTLNRISQYFESISIDELNAMKKPLVYFRNPVLAGRMVQFLGEIGTGIIDYKLNSDEQRGFSRGLHESPPMSILPGDFREEETENPLGFTLRHSGAGGRFTTWVFMTKAMEPSIYCRSCDRSSWPWIVAAFLSVTGST